MTLFEIALLACAGFVAGAANAMVGGGTFFSFPVLLSVGLPPVIANATNTVALWPGAVTASTIYIPELKNVRSGLLSRAAVAALGGAIGAILLLASSNAFFFTLVPWLLAIATLLFAFSARIVGLVSRFAIHHRANAILPLAAEFVFAIYGGYFGAGLGVLLMAGLALAGHDAQSANAQKNLLAAAINGVAAALFVIVGAVRWLAALSVMAGAIAGGFAGAHAARLAPAPALRGVVIAVGTALSLLYFAEVYGGWSL